MHSLKTILIDDNSFTCLEELSLLNDVDALSELFLFLPLFFFLYSASCIKGFIFRKALECTKFQMLVKNAFLTVNVTFIYVFDLPFHGLLRLFLNAPLPLSLHFYYQVVVHKNIATSRINMDKTLK